MQRRGSQKRLRAVGISDIVAACARFDTKQTTAADIDFLEREAALSSHGSVAKLCREAREGVLTTAETREGGGGGSERRSKRKRRRIKTKGIGDDEKVALLQALLQSDTVTPAEVLAICSANKVVRELCRQTRVGLQFGPADKDFIEADLIERAQLAALGITMRGPSEFAAAAERCYLLALAKLGGIQRWDDTSLSSLRRCAAMPSVWDGAWSPALHNPFDWPPPDTLWGCHDGRARTIAFPLDEEGGWEAVAYCDLSRDKRWAYLGELTEEFDAIRSDPDAVGVAKGEDASVLVAALGAVPMADRLRLGCTRILSRLGATLERFLDVRPRVVLVFPRGSTRLSEARVALAARIRPRYAADLPDALWEYGVDPEDEFVAIAVSPEAWLIQRYKDGPSWRDGRATREVPKLEGFYRSPADEGRGEEEDEDDDGGGSRKMLAFSASGIASAPWLEGSLRRGFDAFAALWRWKSIMAIERGEDSIPDAMADWLDSASGAILPRAEGAIDTAAVPEWFDAGERVGPSDRRRGSRPVLETTASVVLTGRQLLDLLARFEDEHLESRLRQDPTGDSGDGADGRPVYVGAYFVIDSDEEGTGTHDDDDEEEEEEEEEG
jgi:hypothetical protein